MPIQNIAGYKFLPLTDLPSLRQHLLARCENLGIKGTILLSNEGININLAATIDAIHQFKLYLQQDSRFNDLVFKESYSDAIPFKRMKIKLKKEIITLRCPEADPLSQRAPEVTPLQLKQWLDEKREFTLLDTRNDYEIQFGTFENAVNLGIDDFCEFPEAAANLDKNKPIVMFCTGGIRCEKAALYLIKQGINNVFQLEGGILNYFEKVGGAHYQGDCFVFDERIALSPSLATSGVKQCKNCSGPVIETHACNP